MEIAFGPTPLYFQIQQKLRSKILNGELKPGDSLPTEAQLCIEYAVSRITVGKALETLVTEGVIHRRRGVGSFVSERPRASKAVRLTGSLDEMLAPVEKQTRQLLHAGTMPPPEVVAEWFQSSRDVFCFEFLHASAGDVFSHSRMYFSAEIGTQIQKSISQSVVPINAAEVLLNVRVEKAEQTINPILASAEVSRRLDVKKGAPLLEVVRTYLISESRPLSVVVATYNPKKYQYKIDLYPGRVPGR